MQRLDSKPLSLTLGTAGHIDHGKSSLIESLTGKHPDRLELEKNRGMSIELGFGSIQLPSGNQIGVVDVPGHKRFVRTMSQGIFATDLVVFVIACNEGIMPQTLEHLEICELLDIREAILVLTKSDLKDENAFPEIYEKILQVKKNSILKNAPTVFFSNKNKESIQTLINEIDRKVASLQKNHTIEKIEDIPYKIWIDRSFSLTGHGSIITGTSLSGRVSKNEDLEILPQKKIGRVRNIQVHGIEASQAEDGERTVINLVNIDKSEIQKGSLLAKPHSVQCSDQFIARFNYLPKNKHPLNETNQLLLGTTHCTVRIRKISPKNNKRIFPDDKCFVLIKSSHILPISRGDRFLLRNGGGILTGGGEILDVEPNPKTLKKSESDSIHYLNLLQNSFEKQDEEQALQSFFVNRGFFGLFENEIMLWVKPEFQNQKKLLPFLNPEIYYRSQIKHSFYLLKNQKDYFMDKIIFFCKEKLKTSPLNSGLGRNEIIDSLWSLSKNRMERKNEKKMAILFDSLINEAEKNNLIFHQNSLYYYSQNKEKLDSKNQGLAIKILNQLNQEKLTPSSIDSYCKELDQEKSSLKTLFEYLSKTGEIVKINSDYYITKKQMINLQNDLDLYFQKTTEFNVSDFKKLTKTTRKHAIPLLEYLDNSHFTLRIGNKRILRKNRSHQSL